eukprot:UN26595
MIKRNFAYNLTPVHTFSMGKDGAATTVHFVDKGPGMDFDVIQGKTVDNKAGVPYYGTIGGGYNKGVHSIVFKDKDKSYPDFEMRRWFEKKDHSEYCCSLHAGDKRVNEFTRNK